MTTRLVKSDEPGVYGTVTTGLFSIQVLFSYGTEGEIDHGIHVTKGAKSQFDYFVTVPVDVFDAIVDVENEEVFIEALRRMFKLLEPRDNGSMNTDN